MSPVELRALGLSVLFSLLLMGGWWAWTGRDPAPGEASPEPEPASPRASGRAAASSGAQALDPVSKEPVDPATAEWWWDLHGTTFYFASKENLERFKEEPFRYVKAKVKIDVQMEGWSEPAPEGAPEPAPQEDGWSDPRGAAPRLEAEPGLPPAREEAEPGWLPPPPGASPQAPLEPPPAPSAPGPSSGGAEGAPSLEQELDPAGIPEALPEPDPASPEEEVVLPEGVELPRPGRPEGLPGP